MNGAVSCPNFSLATTLKSGQVFRWEPLTLASFPSSLPSPPLGEKEGMRGQRGEGFIGWIGPDRVRLRQQGSRLFFQGTTADRIRRFFSLDLDYQKIIREIDVDRVIRGAIQAHRGLRVIRQDPWECLAAFILSSFNNIPRLRGMLNRLAVQFGEPSGEFSATPAPGWPAAHRSASPSEGTPALNSFPHRFPKPGVLAKVSERALRNCGLGYRAPYLKAAAEAVAAGKANLKRWEALDDEALRARLLTIPGVGEKVVECVMLFGFARASAFPVDVWIGRWMRARYFSQNKKVTDRQIRGFARRHFGSHCGWAQQFLYCRARGVRPLGV